MSSENMLSQEEQILLLRYNQENSTISCPKCHSTVLYYDDYCYNCGTNLKDSKRLRDFTFNIINKALYMKYAGICLLREYINNPFLFQATPKVIFDYEPLKLDEILVHFKPLTVSEVLNYLISEGYLKVLEGEEKYKSFFSKCPDGYLDFLLKNNNIKPASSKEGNILFLVNKLPSDVLEQITSSNIEEKTGSNYYEITENAVELVDNNIQCLLYDEIFYDFNLEYYDNQFNKSKDLKEFLIGLVDDSINDMTKELRWQSYSDLLYKYAQVYDFLDDKDKMLYYTLQHIICELNPFDDNKVKSKIQIESSLENRVIYVISSLKKDYNELSGIIEKAYDDVKLPKNFITKEDTKLLIEELFYTYELREVNKHLINIYGVERITEDNLNFNTPEEQEKVIKKLNKLFN